jgi:gas vesicle protein
MTWVALLVGLLLGAALGAWAALWWRDRIPKSQRWLIRHIYTHVDEVLGATKTEHIRREKRRFMVQRWLGRGTRQVQRNNGRVRTRKKLGTAIADFFWDVPATGTGIAALPSVRRMGHYVKVKHSHKPTRRNPAHRWDVQEVWLRWTSEAAANRDNFVDYLERGRPTQGGGLAQALGLEWKPDLFEHTKDYRTSTVHFTRKAPAPEFQPRMRVGVNADDA